MKVKAGHEWRVKCGHCEHGTCIPAMIIGRSQEDVEAGWFFIMDETLICPFCKGVCEKELIER